VFTRIYNNYHDVWNNQVVLVSWKSLEAVALIETHRRCYNQFWQNMKDALKYINTNHTPLFKKLDPVSHGRENIRFTPTKNLEPWNFLTSNPRWNASWEDQEISDYTLGTAKHKVFKYKPSFIFSLSYHLRGETTFPRRHIWILILMLSSGEKTTTSVHASCIGLTPICSDVCMIVVWTESVGKNSGLMQK